ncbi:MAG: 50S ribosomal protein L5 [bacterium]|nr:50S ribosomal protein L5 [bacterium]MDA1024560.1 50S ribosomal protein L5 [bacterium]
MSLKTLYKDTAAKALQDSLGVKNVHAVPKIEKVTVNTRLSAKKDSKFIEILTDTLELISGQKPVITKARKSEAGFKIREGQVVGAMVTLRGERMWDFLDKLVNVTFPRIRDFRGIERSTVDRSGNFNFGFKEHLAFPEVSPDAVDQIHGLQVTVKTSAETKEEGMALFEALGFPFKKSDK